MQQLILLCSFLCSILISPFFALGQTCSGDGSHAVTIQGELKKWHKITLDFAGPNSAETCSTNPFLNYRLNVTFTNGSKTYLVPGYFAADGNAAETSVDAGNIWRCHFAPDETGTWTYTASFRTGSQVAIDLSPTAGTATSFDGASGSFSIAPTDKTGRDFRGKGRLQYVGERYLQFAETGEYFLKGGADAPENLLAYDDIDNTPNNGNRRKSWSPHAGDWNPGDPDWQSGKGRELIGALNYLAGKGMNVFSFLTMNIIGDDRNVFPYRTYNGNTSPQNDRLRMDVSKLAQWEVLFEHADKLGLYLHFKTQETENDQLLDGAQLGPERKLYYRELIARFGHHLALNWNLGEENDIWQEENDPNQLLVKSYAQYVRNVDPYGHHIVIHSYPGHQDEVYDPMLGLPNGLSGTSVQTQWHRVHRDTKTWIDESANAGWQWVVANDEQGSASYGVPPDPGYNGFTLPGNAPSQDDIRREVLWGNLMAGGAGVEYYFGYSLPHSDLSCQDWRSRDRMWDYTRYALEFFTQHLPFTQMNHADGLVNNGFCFAKTDEVYVVYLPNGSASNTLDLGAGTYDVKWYNPRSGGALINDGTETGGSTISIGNPPSQTNQDWVVMFALSGSTFPVELIDFTARSEQDQIHLRWQTAREENSHYFGVERSLDGRLYEEISEVSAAGNSATPINYAFIDPYGKPATLYYRLKMVDLDGTFSYSRTVKITLKVVLVLKAFPNPADGEVTLSWGSVAEVWQEGVLSLINPMGQEMWRTTLEFSVGINQITIPVVDLSPGLYYLQISSGDELLGATRFVKR